jgi:hypothetical protein
MAVLNLATHILQGKFGNITIGNLRYRPRGSHSQASHMWRNSCTPTLSVRLTQQTLITHRREFWDWSHFAPSPCPEKKHTARQLAESLLQTMRGSESQASHMWLKNMNPTLHTFGSICDRREAALPRPSSNTPRLTSSKRVV